MEPHSVACGQCADRWAGSPVDRATGSRAVRQLSRPLGPRGPCRAHGWGRVPDECDTIEAIPWSPLGLLGNCYHVPGRHKGTTPSFWEALFTVTSHTECPPLCPGCLTSPLIAHHRPSPATGEDCRTAQALRSTLTAPCFQISNPRLLCSTTMAGLAGWTSPGERWSAVPVSLRALCCRSTSPLGQRLAQPLVQGSKGMRYR